MTKDNRQVSPGYLKKNVNDLRYNTQERPTKAMNMFSSIFNSDSKQLSFKTSDHNFQMSSNSSEKQGNEPPKKLYLNNSNQETEIYMVEINDKQEQKLVNTNPKFDKSAYSLTQKLVIHKSSNLSIDNKKFLTSSLEASPKIHGKRQFPQKQAEQDAKIYRNGHWVKTKVMLFVNTLSFFQTSLEINELLKIKIIPFWNSSKTKPLNIIKASSKDNIYLFSLSLDKKNYQFSNSYFIFARLIQKKLQLSSVQLTDWNKTNHIDKSKTQDSFIYGLILKRSQILGNWEQRFVVIRKDGIYSFKNSELQETHSFCITNDSMKYIWTRFEMINNYLIIKVKHGVFKTQFGIPISQFSKRGANNWLYAFYRILPTISIQKSQVKF